MLGWVKEFVYSGTYTVSELDWPLLPAYYAGMNLTLGETKGFLSSIELDVGLPTQTGTMTDSDYLNGDGVKTHFSQSDGDLESALTVSSQAGWGIPFQLTDVGTGSVEPFVAFEYMRFEWSAQNGYLQYPPESNPPYTPWSPSTPQVQIYGIGIVYTQNYVIPEAGVKACLPILEGLTVTASFTVSPYLWCWDTDSHILRQEDFYSSMNGGLLLEPRLTATYKISAQTVISLDVLYRHISSLIGDTYVVDTGVAAGQQSQTYSNIAGASFDVVNISVSLKVGL
jgi:outer membrane protease